MRSEKLVNPKKTISSKSNQTFQSSLDSFHRDLAPAPELCPYGLGLPQARPAGVYEQAEQSSLAHTLTSFLLNLTHTTTSGHCNMLTGSATRRGTINIKPLLASVF